MDNVALQKIMVNKAIMSFGVAVDVSLLVVNLKANMEYNKATSGGAKLGSAAKTYTRSTLTTPTTTIRHHTTICSKNLQQPTGCGYYVKHRLPVTNRQTRLEHSVDNLRLSNAPSTTTKRAHSQWTRIPAGAQRRRARKRRKTTRADADTAGTIKAGAPNTTANHVDAASQRIDG